MAAERTHCVRKKAGTTIDALPFAHSYGERAIPVSGTPLDAAPEAEWRQVQ